MLARASCPLIQRNWAVCHALSAPAVPIKYLWEYLIKGKTLEAFLDDFEGVLREEAIAALEQAYERLLEGLPLQELEQSQLRHDQTC
jgi:hypothetical protein